MEFEFTVNGKVDLPNACLVFTERCWEDPRRVVDLGHKPYWFRWKIYTLQVSLT